MVLARRQLRESPRQWRPQRWRMDTGGGWRTAAWQGRSGGWQSYNTGSRGGNYSTGGSGGWQSYNPGSSGGGHSTGGTGGGYNTGGDYNTNNGGRRRRQHDDVECPTLGRRPVQGSQVSAKAT